MNKLRIVFMGTPDFAVATLKNILEKGYEVAAVITAPDRPAGRGRKLQQSAVKEFALQKGIKILQPANLKDPGFLEELRSLEANLQVVVAFRMLPEAVWKMPEFGTFNLHASLLPDYRGAAPINWAVMDGETKTGVTTFFIDEKIDTGEIILQKETEIGPTETAGELHDKLMSIGGDLVVDTLKMIEQGKVVTKAQNKSEHPKTAHKIHKETCRIDWNRRTREIYNKIRGLSPYPAAWSVLQNGGEEIPVKIYNTQISEEAPTAAPGTIILKDKTLRVITGDGQLEIQELQLAGKRKMQVKDVLNGISLEANAKML